MELHSCSFGNDIFREGSSRCVVANDIQNKIVVNELEFQSLDYLDFKTNTLRIGIDTFIPPDIG